MLILTSHSDTICIACTSRYTANIEAVLRKRLLCLCPHKNIIELMKLFLSPKGIRFSYLLILPVTHTYFDPNTEPP